MKKLLTASILLALCILLAHFSANHTLWDQSKLMENHLPIENATLSQENLFGEIQTTTPQIMPALTCKDNSIESQSQTYSINHKKDNSTYSIIVKWDVVPLADVYPELVDVPFYSGNDNNTFNRNFMIEVFNAKSKLLQIIPLDNSSFAGISFQDVNLDGYTDIVVNTGGTLNETHELYLWNEYTLNYCQVTFSGFEMLSYYEIHDGYLLNWVKDTTSSGFIQKLVWDANILVIETEDAYGLHD